MNVVLCRSGLLHLAGRCGVKYGDAMYLRPNEDVIGFVMMAFRGLCRRCFKQ